MAKNAPPMAKDQMRRCLRAIVDPHSSRKDVDRLWQYFDSSCAYCGKRLERASRSAHVDHLDSPPWWNKQHLQLRSRVRTLQRRREARNRLATIYRRKSISARTSRATDAYQGVDQASSDTFRKRSGTASEG